MSIVNVIRVLLFIIINALPLIILGLFIVGGLSHNGYI